MNTICLVIFFLLVTSSLNAQGNFSEPTQCVIDPFLDYWKCINESSKGRESFRKDHLFYFQAIRTTVGYEITFHKGEMDSSIKEIIENTLDCADSRNNLSIDVKFIFSHSHNGRLLTPEMYAQEIEKFKEDNNIAENICDYKIGSSNRIR